MTHDLKVHAKGDKSAPTSGVMGQISFRRLVDALRAAGEFQPGEHVTDLIVDIERGVIVYKVEM